MVARPWYTNSNWNINSAFGLLDSAQRDTFLWLLEGEFGEVNREHKYIFVCYNNKTQSIGYLKCQLLWCQLSHDDKQKELLCLVLVDSFCFVRISTILKFIKACLLGWYASSVSAVAYSFPISVEVAWPNAEFITSLVKKSTGCLVPAILWNLILSLFLLSCTQASLRSMCFIREVPSLFLANSMAAFAST